MSRLAEIYRYEKSKGGGVLSTLKERAKEKFDPRSYINRRGLLASIFPFLKSYRSPAKRFYERRDYTRPESISPIPGDINVLKNLKLIQNSTDFTARNTMILPSMAKDIKSTVDILNKLQKSMVSLGRRTTTLSQKLNTTNKTTEKNTKTNIEVNTIILEKFKDVAEIITKNITLYPNIIESIKEINDTNIKIIKSVIEESLVTKNKPEELDVKEPKPEEIKEEPKEDTETVKPKRTRKKTTEEKSEETKTTTPAKRKTTPKKTETKTKESYEKPIESLPSVSNVTENETLKSIQTGIENVEKNTNLLSGISNDISVLKRTMIKMSKSLIEGPTGRAEKYFQKSKSIENEYEEKFKKINNLPEKVEKEKEKEKSWSEKLFGALIKGGLIVGIVLALKEYFTTPEFRDAVNGLLEGFFKTLIPIISDYWKEILIGFAILKPLTTIMTGINLFSMIFSSGGKLMKTLLGLGVLFGIGSIAKSYTKDSERLKELKQKQADQGALTTEEQTELGNLEQSRLKPETANKIAGVGAVAAGTFAAGSAYKIGKLIPATRTAILDARTTTVQSATGGWIDKNPTTKWGRFLKFLERRAPKLFAKVGLRLAQAAALMAIPIAGWVGALVQLGLSFWTAWEVYELWREYNSLTEDEKVNLEDKSPVKAIKDNLQNEPTKVELNKDELKQKIQEKLKEYPEQSRIDPNVQRRVREEAEAEMRAGTPRNKATAMQTKGASGSLDKPEQMTNKPTPTSKESSDDSPLLSLIRKVESQSQYDAFNRGSVGTGGKYPGMTDMTVGQIMELQNKKGSDRISAAGAYQIIPSTLSRLVKQGVVSTEDKFDAATQDKLGNALVQERLSAAGNDPIKQQYELSKEWAAIPVPKGLALENKEISDGTQSYYKGKGGNKALVSSDSVQSALGNIEAETQAMTPGDGKSTTKSTSGKETPITTESTFKSITSFLGGMGEDIFGKDAPAFKILEKFNQDIGGKENIKQLYRGSSEAEQKIKNLEGSTSSTGDFIERASQENIQGRLESSRAAVDVKLPSVETDQRINPKPPSHVPMAQAPVTDPDMLQHVLYISKGIPYLTAGMYS